MITRPKHLPRPPHAIEGRARRLPVILLPAIMFWTALLVREVGTARGEEQVPLAAASDTEIKEDEAKGDAAKGANAKNVPVKAHTVPLESADDEQARRRAFSTGVVMLGGILICGVGLIAIVLLWGNRTRRIARQALPKVSPRDELWYLKHKVESDLDRPLDRNKNDDSPTEPGA